MHNIHRRSWFSGLLCCTTLVLGFLPTTGNANAAAKAAPPPLSALSVERRIELEGLLAQDLQRVASSNPYYTGKAAGPLSVKLDPQRGVVILDLGAEFGPDSSGDHEMEDLLHDLESTAWWMLKDVFDYQGTEFLYGGKDLYYYHPELWHPSVTSAAQPAALNSEGVTIQANPIVVVSPGHGLYRLYNKAGDKFDWVYQRPRVNDFQEDLVTYSFAQYLKSSLFNYSKNTTIVGTRGAAYGEYQYGGDHASRYYLEAKYPDHPEIWHSLPNSTKVAREYDEDINSRPLFANHIGAAAIIHLHTNAAKDNNPMPSGARAYFAPGNPASQRLADSLLCGMAEALGTDEDFRNFMVANASRSSTGYGENNLAKMPSALLEIGFHTNPSDAAFMKNVDFRRLAMRGVAKGYSIYSEGKICVPFDVAGVSKVDGEQDGSDIEVTVATQGFPDTYTLIGSTEHQVVAFIESVSCPDNVECNETSWLGIHAKSEQKEGAYKFVHACYGPEKGRDGEEPEAFTARYRVTLADYGDVITKPMEYDVTCRPPGKGTSTQRRIVIREFVKPDASEE